MRERINRLAKGIVESVTPQIKIIPERFFEGIPKGEISHREIRILGIDETRLKGLIYSSNSCVRLLQSTFQGSDNRITIEIDGRYLTKEDNIEGTFSFVMDGKEETIPYSFWMEPKNTIEVLENLKTKEDFAKLVAKDFKQALVLFSYKDFDTAPFMQEHQTRVLFQGLKCCKNMSHRLEEFLVSLHVKESIQLKVRQEISERSLVICVEKNTWGYVEFQVITESDFIVLEQQHYTVEDFKDSQCYIRYQINQEKLHPGKNIGWIQVRNIKENFQIPIESWGVVTFQKERWKEKQASLRYQRLRLQYELAPTKGKTLFPCMLNELKVDTPWNLLFRAEIYGLQGKKEQALALLDHEGLGMNFRWFCLFVKYQIEKTEEQKKSLIDYGMKLTPRTKEEKLLKCLILSLESDPLEGYRQLFRLGFSSPFLYQKAFEIYRGSPELLYTMEKFEKQVLIFAQKQELIDETLASDLAGMVNVPLSILYKLYEKFALPEVLSSICRILIRKECKDNTCFIWYQRAFLQKLPITKLYEYYLYTLPDDYGKLLPTEILLYFSYEKIIDYRVKEILYPNIMAYMPTNLILFRQYVRDIERFAVEELLKGNMNPRLAFLYQKVLYPEMIDEKIAQVLPRILQSYYIQVKNPNMTHAVVCYQELQQEDVIPLKNGIGYVPLCLEGATLLFQDKQGNRYVEIPYDKTLAMSSINRKEMEIICSQYFPSHPTLRLQECEEVVRQGISCMEDISIIQSALKELKLHPHYQKKLQRLILDYYKEIVVEKSSHVTTFLNSLNLKELSRKERAMVCEILIDADYMIEAFKMIQEYGWEEIKGEHLLKLCHYMILKIKSGQGDLLTTLAFQSFQKGEYSKAILTHLCKHFNGSSVQMFDVLETGISYQIGIHDLVERLLAQMIFTDETKNIDQVFEWYLACGKTQENIVKAFFTVKSVKYFFEQQETSRKVFSWLENALERVGDMGKAPTVYLMTLTKYYAELKCLDMRQKKLCVEMVEHLLLEKRVFPHFKGLIEIVPKLSYLEEQVLISHRIIGKEKPQIIVRILPQEERFQPSHMTCVYPGVYVFQKMLFDEETLDYQILEGDGEQRICVQKGKVCREGIAKFQSASQYELLNQMEQQLAEESLDSLKVTMKQYLLDQMTMELLFPLMTE